MSLSKKLWLRSDSQKRQSFSYRFCDDLCEEILQYLSLEDKLRLQCVSKQFQRTVFQRQYELYINIGNEEKHNYLSYYHNYYYIEDQSMHSFKALLKKCPNITSIQLETHDSDNCFNKVFRLIIKNCNNLSEVIVENYINDSNFEEFHRKFGTKIKYLRTLRELKDLNRFPNIERIENNPFIDISTIPQLKLVKLKIFKINIYHEQESQNLQTVIDTFPTLTHLNVFINFVVQNDFKSLKNISNLKQLIHFKFVESLMRSNERFCGLLKQMAKSCPNIKSIVCCFSNDGLNSFKQLLSHLKAFPALRRLNVITDLLIPGTDDNTDVNQWFSFELFKEFVNITHLRLGFNIISIFNKPILKEIDIYLPNLQYLAIDNQFDTTPEGVTQMTDILSRLSSLETLKLVFKSRVDSQLFKEQIIEKCRKIREIEIQPF